MGGACCSLRDDWEDFADPNSSICRNCMPSFSPPKLLIPGMASLSSTASIDNSLADMFHAPPRPLPYDADPRYFRLQRGLASRREKGSSHAHVETEPLRTSEDDDEESELVSKKSKWNEFTCEDTSKAYNSRSSLKLSTAKPGVGFAHNTSSEDEDVCPTCLEGDGIR